MSSNEAPQPPRRRWTRIPVAVVLGAATTILSVVAGLAVNVATDAQPPRWLGTADQFASVVGLLVGVVGLLIAVRTLRLPKLTGRLSTGDAAVRSTEPTVEARIEEATRALRVSAGLVSELQAEMNARMAALERLRFENDEFEKLAAVRREEAEAVTRLVESVISNTHAKLSRSSRRDQVLFFVAGLAASIPVQVLITWLGS